MTYPNELQKVFEAHGGLDKWQDMKTLVFELPKEPREKHITDLRTRKDRIETTSFQMGYDGQNTWIADPDKAYKGNPEFYHNLMFYFYAMPFVLADKGIFYETAENLEFEGKQYPGLAISYGEGVGTSPKDEYYIHYDPETFRMAWLGYTVTYRTGEDSDEVKWIRYDNWELFNGLLLPRSISWYSYEGREIGGLRNTVVFENVEIKQKPMETGFFDKPEDGVIFARLPEAESN